MGGAGADHGRLNLPNDGVKKRLQVRCKLLWTCAGHPVHPRRINNWEVALLIARSQLHKQVECGIYDVIRPAATLLHLKCAQMSVRSPHSQESPGMYRHKGRSGIHYSASTCTRTTPNPLSLFSTNPLLDLVPALDTNVAINLTSPPAL